MPLSSKWFQGFKGTQTDKVKREESIRNHKFVLDILSGIIETELKELEVNRVADYTLPGWAYLQADKAGATRTLRNLLKLTKLEKD